MRNSLSLSPPGTKFAQPFVKVVCQANIITWIACDDASCTQNCVAGSAPANNDQCEFAVFVIIWALTNTIGTPNGLGSASGALNYYRYYCPGIVTTTATTTTQTTAAATVPAASGWNGNYRVTSTCNSANCCCFTGVVGVAQTGTTVRVNGALTGSCGANASPATISITLSSSSSASASFTFLSQPFTATLTGNTITLTNVNFPQCSGTAVRSSMASIMIPSLFVLLLLVTVVAMV